MNLHPKKFAAALATMLALGGLCAAAPQDAPPADAASVLRELEAAVKRHDAADAAARQKIATTLRGALASGSAASSLYEQAVKGTDFEGKQGSAKSFSDWKSKNAAMLRSDQLQAAAMFHTRYLLIGLQLRETDDRQEAAKSSFDYAKDYIRQFSDKKFMDLPKPAYELLNEPINKSPFVKWLALTPRLPANTAWEPVPGRISDILEKNVRDPWRANADPRLDATWAMQIDYESARAAAGGSDWDRGQFETIAKPRLLFGRAADRAVAGQPNLAIKEMLGLIKAHPGHPDWKDWAQKLRTLVEPAAPSGTD